MVRLRFLIAKHDIDGIPGLEKGAAVVKEAHETVEGYEYVVWLRLDGGVAARTRVEHLADFIPCEVDGEDMNECVEKATELSDGIAYGGRECDGG